MARTPNIKILFDEPRAERWVRGVYGWRLWAGGVLLGLGQLVTRLRIDSMHYDEQAYQAIKKRFTTRSRKG